MSDKNKDIDFIFIGDYKDTLRSFNNFEHIPYKNKPFGCLWTSPMISSLGMSEWEYWEITEGAVKPRLDEFDSEELKRYAKDGSSTRWHIVPTDDSRILYLDANSPEMHKYRYYYVGPYEAYDTWISKQNNEHIVSGSKRLDFEAIRKDYDAVYISRKVMDDVGGCGCDKYMFGGWDVGTCVFMNPKKYYVLNDEQYALYKKGKFIPQPITDEQIEIAESEYLSSPEYKAIKKYINKVKADKIWKDSFIFKGKEADDYEAQKNLSCALVWRIKDGLDYYFRNVYCNPALKETMLKEGANPNVRTCGGKTPLMYMNDLYDVDLLLKYGADPLAVDNEGKSVLDYAKDLGDKEIIARIQYEINKRAKEATNKKDAKEKSVIPPKKSLKTYNCGSKWLRYFRNLRRR